MYTLGSRQGRSVSDATGVWYQDSHGNDHLAITDLPGFSTNGNTNLFPDAGVLSCPMEGCPSILTTFVDPRSPSCSTSTRPIYRWAFGSSCIILVLFSNPVLAILGYHEIKAKKPGYLSEKSRRSAWESAKFYFVDLDVIGMILTIEGLSLILTPLNIATCASNGKKMIKSLP